MKAHFQLYTIKDKFYEGQAGNDELIGRWGETQEETEGHLNKRQKGKKKKKKQSRRTVTKRQRQQKQSRPSKDTISDVSLIILEYETNV